MPEISEVARIVHFLRIHLKGRRIASISAEDDPIVYGKVGTSADAFKKALTGRTVVDAKQQGKYFWLEMDKPPHPLMHFGMTGWLKLRHVETGYYKPEDDKKGNMGPEHEKTVEWPPRFHKFVMKMEGEPACEAAFQDARRLGRIRLVDVPASEMRTSSPLKENGPDPVIDKDIVTLEWLSKLMKRKKSPIKAVLLEQSNLSGVGNWVGDEVLYHAAIHPEQYSNTLSDAQIKKLYESLMYVCDTACGVLGDSDQYPPHWLFKHRWGKGKDAAKKLPNGEKIVFVTVGGRTSAVVPGVQKKSGGVAADVKDETDEEEDEIVEKKPKVKKEPKKASAEQANGTTPNRKRKSNGADIKEESETPSAKKAKATGKTKQVNGSSVDSGKRRSGRLSKG